MLFWLQLHIIIIVIIIIIIYIFLRFSLHEWRDCNLGACHYQSEQSEHLVIQKLNPIFEVASYKQASRRNIYFVNRIRKQS